eukprot:1195454-Prorocentrum_minimum.AAC.10
MSRQASSARRRGARLARFSELRSHHRSRPISLCTPAKCAAPTPATATCAANVIIIIKLHNAPDLTLH